MIDKQTIIEYVEETYNSSISVFDFGSFVRVTNGSAAMYGDIHVDNDTLKIGGERYGETFQREYPQTIEGLQNALSENLGL